MVPQENYEDRYPVILFRLSGEQRLQFISFHSAIPASSAEGGTVAVGGNDTRGTAFRDGPIQAGPVGVIRYCEAPVCGPAPVNAS